MRYSIKPKIVSPVCKWVYVLLTICPRVLQTGDLGLDLGAQGEPLGYRQEGKSPVTDVGSIRADLIAPRKTFSSTSCLITPAVQTERLTFPEMTFAVDAMEKLLAQNKRTMKTGGSGVVVEGLTMLSIPLAL